MLDLNESMWMEISLNTVITKTTTASKKSAWDSQRLSETTPLTAAETEACARNTRKTSNPLWLRVFIPQQCLPIFFCGCEKKKKNPELSLFLAAAFMSWLVLTRNQLSSNHLQMYLSFIAHDCNCFPPRQEPGTVS